jgi:poly-gamma-glutamate capsule biosynthesis protein CapA/YwtB (metallophosphatase superfamily)
LNLHLCGTLSLFLAWTLSLSTAAQDPSASSEPPVSPAAPFLRVTAVGDINLGSAYPSESNLPPQDGEELLKPVEPLLKGNIVFGNLEGPLADDGTTAKCSPTSKMCFAFRTPTTYVKNLKAAGFNVLGIANNHANDFGEEGRKSTLRSLDQARILHSGPAGDIAEFEIDGKKIALIAFGTGDLSYNLLRIDEAASAVLELHKNHDAVLVSFHGGSEGIRAEHVSDEMEFLGSEKRGHLIQFAHAVIDAGADLVLGHGPHLLRGMEIYRGRLVAYSLGNFCTYGGFNLTGPLGKAVILSVDLDGNDFSFQGGNLSAVVQEGRGGPKPDPTGEGIATVTRLSREDFRFSAPAFGENGALLPPASDTAGLFMLPSPSDRAALKKLLSDLVSLGVPEDRVRRIFGDQRTRLLPEVLARFAKPAEKLPFEKYRKIFVNDEVITAGKKFIEQNADLLSAISSKYQVDREAIVAILATETRFGTKRGEYGTFNALATLAILDARRTTWARDQLKALLMGFPDPLSVIGSYAGAVGLVQFMPVNIQKYGVDWNQDGRIDLDEIPDALASAANYLKAFGWRQHKPIKPKSANYTAIFKYNPAHPYVQVVTELAKAFGYP